MPMTSRNYPGLLFRTATGTPVNDVLAIEEVLSISINDIPYTITMRSPGNETDLCRGLLFTEGIYKDSNPELEITVTATNDRGEITAVNLVIPENQIHKEFSDSRSVISVSSCGMCGKTAFEDSTADTVIHENGTINPRLISEVFEKMSRSQASFQQTGGTHAAAAFTLDGELMSLREDIGRHNAVDKVIGALLLNKQLDKARILTVSGRISYEIVNKALMAGIPFLASVSAPSSMAVENAKAAGMTLLAFCRTDKCTVYSHPERVVLEKMDLQNR